jgi:thiamine biosynthesis protein ThiS
MIRVEDDDHRVSWREGLTMADLLRQLDENRPLVAVVLNGRYVARSNFSRTKITDGAEVRLIPWKEGMTLADLVKYEIDEDYFSAATVDRRLVPEVDFSKTVISKDAEVWLLPPVGGG